MDNTGTKDSIHSVLLSWSFSVIQSLFLQGKHPCLRQSHGLRFWILFNRVKCIGKFIQMFLGLLWGFENEAKFYSCEVIGFKLCPSVFADIYEIMLYSLQGTGDIDCHFKIKKNLENASVSLESTKSPGLFVGLQSDGQAKAVIYTKNGNVFFYPQVIKCMFNLKYFVVLLCDGLCTMIISSYFFSGSFCY